MTGNRYGNRRRTKQDAEAALVSALTWRAMPPSKPLKPWEVVSWARVFRKTVAEIEARARSHGVGVEVVAGVVR